MYGKSFDDISLNLLSKRDKPILRHMINVYPNHEAMRSLIEKGLIARIFQNQFDPLPFKNNGYQFNQKLSPYNIVAKESGRKICEFDFVGIRGNDIELFAMSETQEQIILLEKLYHMSPIVYHVKFGDKLQIDQKDTKQFDLTLGPKKRVDEILNKCFLYIHNFESKL